MKKLKAFELLVASKEFFYPLQKSGDINYMQIAKQQINDIDEAIEELESLEHKDRLAELEKVILDYYLGKGYQVGVGHWNFNVEIDSLYKSKTLKVKFVDYEKEIDSFECKIEVETTKEMFDKAIEYFKGKK